MDETTTDAGAGGDHRATATAPSEPDVIVLAFMALALAAVSLVLAASYFFSPLAYLGGSLALFLGHAARGHEHSRRLGTAAVVMALVAMVVATALLAPT